MLTGGAGLLAESRLNNVRRLREAGIKADGLLLRLPAPSKLAIGHQDLRIDGLRPKRPGVTIVGASSDHLVMDVTEAAPPVHVGDELEFDPIYAAVATAMANVDVMQVVKPMQAD